jgi:hypothetical protein
MSLRRRTGRSGVGRLERGIAMSAIFDQDPYADMNARVRGRVSPEYEIITRWVLNPRGHQRRQILVNAAGYS